MKRWYLIGWMAVALVTMCVMMARPAEANSKATSDVVSHAKPVMVPYLNKPITEINMQEVETNERTEENPGTTGQAESGDIGPEPEVEGSGDEADGPCDAMSEDSEGLGEPEEYGLTYLGDWTITAYCSCSICTGDYAGGCTASGTIPEQGRTVACNCLPMGSQVLVGDNIYTVEDTGWTPYGDAWLDIYFESHDSALAFGVREMEVYLVNY